MEHWFEIFKTGTHTDSAGTTSTFTEADLDRIAETYNPAEREAPIVIGHPASNAPAYGWIAALKRHGDRLLALPKQLAPAFLRWVRNGTYKKRSISLHPDGTLRHVGFLGAAPPAVAGLADAAFTAGAVPGFEQQDDADTLRAQLRRRDFEAAIDSRLYQGGLAPAAHAAAMALYDALLSPHTDFSAPGNPGSLETAITDFLNAIPPLQLSAPAAGGQQPARPVHHSPLEAMSAAIRAANNQ